MSIGTLAKTSIVILTYNKLEYTQACIESIRKFTQRGSYEVIIVDNNSTDGTREWLAEQTDLLTIFNSENVGFPKGCNQGIEVASGDNIMLLNNDIIVTENWLPPMIEALYSSNNIGAVGPVTNSAYNYQEISVNHKTLDEMWKFAASYNRHDSSQWERRLKLIGFCMIIKREAIDRIGVLDEIFSPGMCEDSDFSFRLLEAGYELLLCKNVFIHHFGSTSFGEMPERTRNLLATSRKKFLSKWGFHTAYSTEIRHDLIALMDDHAEDEAIRVLDVGCACGGTLLEISNKYKNAELYGVEKNHHAAVVAARFAEISNIDVEDGIEYPPHFFDYVLLGNILEQLQNPANLLLKLRGFLKKDGKILAVIPNAMHHSVLRGLLNGKWTYTETGIIGRDNLRFFTLEELLKLFREAGFNDIKYGSAVAPLSELDKKWIEQLSNLSELQSSNQFMTYQYTLVASHTEPKPKVNELLLNVEQGNNKESSLRELTSMIREGHLDTARIIKAVHEDLIEKQYVLNILANMFFAESLFENIIPLLNESLLVNSEHADTLFNYGFIMYKIGAYEKALGFLNLIKIKDEETIELISAIKKINND
ncbi:bifunctional glycosyltransferase family 2 protein/class I SAM-dependent methyltransferase [Bacillus sp. 3255]|uniref:bifunctional glycosyltransferase family 2 protein/class I SAM-dependent methyltransferase n=1 Tax=Bacillus sp. 3255 TaxID=2817904 RepID=UPI00285B6FCD|nr:bifunctional glycosyltransferase family 2 protein/class I SAM-dependent methyltransferase [Bacillus sp. 3255]MDR6883472.1 GT2 family glycosyltransferase/ubiquinone/menaquinone biosynthesis C-methylase UbiE [Bacillus sp. 3255]